MQEDSSNISSSEASIARKRRMEIIHHQKLLQGKQRHRDRDHDRDGSRNGSGESECDKDHVQLVSSSDEDEQHCPCPPSVISSQSSHSSQSLALPLPPKKRKVSVEMLNSLTSVEVATVQVPPAAAAASPAVAVSGTTTVIQQSNEEMHQDISNISKNNQVLTLPSNVQILQGSKTNKNNIKEQKVINTTSSTVSTVTSSTSTSPKNKDVVGTTKNHTKQKRYEPETPMTKEQTAAWRREARKVRNRQSAAKSREKIKNRINVLELEVEEWKAKYQEVFQRLQELEK